MKQKDKRKNCHVEVRGLGRWGCTHTHTHKVKQIYLDKE